MAIKPEFLVTKDETLIALMTILVTILSIGMALKYSACVEPAVFKRKLGQIGFFCFSGGHLWLQCRIPKYHGLMETLCTSGNNSLNPSTDPLFWTQFEIIEAKY